MRPTHVALLLVALSLPVTLAAEREIEQVLPKDRIPAILEPTFVPASEAKLDDDTPVIGIDLGGLSHCYSLYLLNHHEIVNDEVGGHPIAVTW